MSKQKNNVIEKSQNTEKSLFSKLGAVAGEVTSKSKELIIKTQETVVHTIDKNGDGQIDRTDFGLDAESIEETKEKAKQLAADAGEKLKNTGDIVKKAFIDVKEELDRKTLRPVFLKDIVNISEEHTLSDRIFEATQSMIRIVGRDKKREMNTVCNGAIGYRETIKGIDLLSIYEEHAKELGVKFLPNISQTFFYIDSFQNNVYIALDEYFTYFRKQRVSELEMISQKLGAKRVTISFRESEKNVVKRDAQAKVKIPKGAGIINERGENVNTTSLEIEVDSIFSGHNEPIKPTLTYFKDEGDIEHLIQMRLDQSTNCIQEKTYRLQCSRSLGIKESVAVQIDGVLQQLKCSGNTSLMEEIRREGRTILEYHIEF